MTEYYKLFNEYVHKQILKVPSFKDKLIAKLKEKYVADKIKFEPGMGINPASIGGLMPLRGVTVIPAPTKPIKTFDEYIDEKLNKDVHYMNYSDNTLIALTEAPTQNIKEWSSRKYEQNGVNVSILRMVSTGYHDPEIWKSILFQLHNAVYILHKKGICIWNFNLENNVYIKDTNYDNNNIGFWKYIINGVEFYVPNYGSILLIDTNFKDLDVTGMVDSLKLKSSGDITRLGDNDFRYKIMMREFFDKTEEREINRRNNELFKNEIFNTNKFDSSSDKTYGGIAPDTTIKSIIDKIGRGENNVENIIINHGHYLHNRTGTLLNENEKKNIIADNKDFKAGDLVSLVEDGLNHYIAVYYKDIVRDGTKVGAKIVKVTRDVNNKVKSVEIKDVELAQISMINEKIKQSYKPNQKLAEEDLIETYEINF